MTSLINRLRGLVREFAKFGSVGALSFVLDIALFNVLASGAGVGPLISKAIATTIAATASYFLNRHWTWRDRARTGLGREYWMFIVLSAVGLGIVEVCLAFSNYVLGLTGPFWDNVSANGVGLVLGTAWRFWSFKRWVFLPVEDEVRAEQDSSANATV